MYYIIVILQNEANNQHARRIPAEGADTPILVQSVRLLTCLACLSTNVILKNECCFRILCFRSFVLIVYYFTSVDNDGYRGKRSQLTFYRLKIYFFN